MLETGVWLLRSLRVACLAMCLGTTAICAAQTATEATPAQIREAAEAFDRGREAYQTQNFVGAAEQFERADSQAPSATALEYAIRARDKAGHLDRAATLAALAQKRYPEDQNLAAVVTDVLSRAEGNLFALSVQCTEACELAVGGKIVHGAPDTQRLLYLPEGTHSVRAGFAEARGDSREVQATKGGNGQIAFVAPPVDTQASEPPPQEIPPTAKNEQPAVRSSGWSPTVFWVGVGVTAVATGITVWSGIDTLNNPGKERIRNECGPEQVDCAAYQEGLAHQRRTNVLIGVSAGLGAATVLIGALATDWGGSSAVSEPLMSTPKKPSVAGVRVEPWLSVASGALLGAQGRF